MYSSRPGLSILIYFTLSCSERMSLLSEKRVYLMVAAGLGFHVRISILLNHSGSWISPFISDRINVESPVIVKTEKISVVRGSIKKCPFYTL